MHIDDLAYQINSRSIRVEMVSVACPDAVQSEGYISTVALFLTFASSPEEKVYLRLPSVWRDFWEELACLKQKHDDKQDRGVLRELRSMMDEFDLQDVHLASNGTNSERDNRAKKQDPKMEALGGSGRPYLFSPDEMKAIWMAKERAPSYQHMLTSRMNLPISNFKDDLLVAIQDHQVIIICGETGCGKSTQGEHWRPML